MQILDIVKNLLKSGFFLHQINLMFVVSKIKHLTFTSMKKLLTILFSASILLFTACEDPNEEIFEEASKDQVIEFDETTNTNIEDFERTTD